MWNKLPFWTLKDSEISEESLNPKIGLILHREAIRVVLHPNFSFDSFWRQIEDPFYDLSDLDEWIIDNAEAYEQVAREYERRDRWCANLRQSRFRT